MVSDLGTNAEIDIGTAARGLKHGQRSTDSFVCGLQLFRSLDRVDLLVNLDMERNHLYKGKGFSSQKFFTAPHPQNTIFSV